jgi:light-regulated signal transduction histidine kinase (bacteriophytochrome)
MANLSAAIRENAAGIKKGELPVVNGDETQLLQLFQNLIGNAIKFQKPGAAPEVHISSGKQGDSWLFSVTDNGIGIDNKFSDRIFEIFQRLHTREQYPGTGIGLAVCKKIVERHGGRIWVDSKPGQGTTFFFTIPYR